MKNDFTADGKHALQRLENITGEVCTEDALIRAEKMITIGGLAAGMAHEINNPLASILQGLQVIEDRVAPGFPPNLEAATECGISLENLNAYFERRRITRFLSAIKESAERAAVIVENMLSFSRKSGANFWPHDLGELWDKSLELAKNEYDLKKRYDFREITIVREYAPDLPKVPCDAVKIQQVFLNLLKNSAQAMAHGRDKTRRPRIVLRTKKEADMARVELQDNGPGMPENILRRVFEPFFTTKEDGEGTGLGLSVSSFIITHDHGGSMEARSVPFEGATFIIRLPLSLPRG